MLWIHVILYDEEDVTAKRVIENLVSIIEGTILVNANIVATTHRKMVKQKVGNPYVDLVPIRGYPPKKLSN